MTSWYCPFLNHLQIPFFCWMAWSVWFYWKGFQSNLSFWSRSLWCCQCCYRHLNQSQSKTFLRTHLKRHPWLVQPCKSFAALHNCFPWSVIPSLYGCQMPRPCMSWTHHLHISFQILLWCEDAQIRSNQVLSIFKSSVRVSQWLESWVPNHPLMTSRNQTLSS